MVHHAIRKLHQHAHEVISGQTAWPVSPDDNESIWKMLADSGMAEELPDGGLTYTLTAEIQLLLVCVGALCPWEMPFFLEEHGHASEEEALEVWEAETEAEALRLLKLLIILPCVIWRCPLGG
jgi:hypothetical protein